MSIGPDGTGVVKGYHIGPGVDLAGADLTDADLRRAKLVDAKLMGAYLMGADLRRANLRVADLTGAHLRGAKLSNAKMIRANLFTADLEGATMRGTDLRNAILFEAKLMEADLRNAKLSEAILIVAKLMGAKLMKADLRDARLEGANLEGANLDGANLDGANLEGANLEGAILPRPRSRARSYGGMTGPILKIGKPDSPSKAADFKRRYPAEFERLKGDTSGRDFTESLRESLREKYRTPFDWVVTGKTYNRPLQRLSDKPNKVLLLNVNTQDGRYTAEQRDLLTKLSMVSQRSGHPYEGWPLFTIGWIRYAQDDAHGVLLIEEVQSDVEVVRTKMKGDTKEKQQLELAGINTEEYVEVLDLLRPYSARFYEDAIGLIYQEAEALDYTVEMLGYGDKKQFCYIDDDGIERCPPIWVYKDLPKRLGMSQKRESEVPTNRPLEDKVSYYKPNPGIPPRYRQECCVCSMPASLMSAAGDVFCEDCF